MKRYQWVLFDADDTLFSFNSFAGLQAMFLQFNVEFTKAHYKEYQKLNKPLWDDYQNNKISAEYLQRQRFLLWAEKLNVDAYDLNTLFLKTMVSLSKPLDGALDLINKLYGKSKMAIITNGFTELQYARLKHNHWEKFFEFVIISEQVGVPKPHPEIFNASLEKMGFPATDSVLMVGDNLSTDILGGINAGMDTCWLNAHSQARNPDIKPTFEVQNLIQLANFL